MGFFIAFVSAVCCVALYAAGEGFIAALFYGTIFGNVIALLFILLYKK